MARNLTERQKLVLLGALVAILAIVVAINWAGRRKADLYGPTLLAQASDQRIWLLSNHELFILAPSGATLRRVPVRDLGIATPLAALAPLPDGAILVGSRESGLVHIVGADGTMRATIDPSGAGERRLFGAFHLLPIPGSDDIIAADTSNHRVLRIARTGRILNAFGSTDGRPGALHFPNGLSLDAAGRVLLVDTNHHTVRAFTVALEPLPTPGFAVRGERGYRWPALVAAASEGAMFVSVMGHGMERGRVFKFDAEGRRLRELALPATADPQGLIALADGALVSDQVGLAVHRYALDGSYAGEFGDETLAAAHDDVARLRRLYPAVIHGGQASLVVVLIGLLLVLRRERAGHEKRGAELVKLATDHPRPGPFRLYSYSLWFLLRIGFVVIALNGILNILLQHLMPRRFDWAAFLETQAWVLAFFAAVCAVAVWHFDRMLRAGRYSGILASVTQRLLRRLGAQLEGVLQPDETVEELALAGSLFGKVQLLVLTRDRLLVLTLRATLRELARVQEAPRAAISSAALTRSDVPFWLRLLGVLRAVTVEIAIGPERHRFAVLDPLAAERLTAALAATAKGAGAGIAHLDELRLPGVQAPVPGPGRLAISMLLSAILPGLGQLYQQRLAIGVFWLLAAGSVILQFMQPVIATLRKTMEVHPNLLVVAAIASLFVWGLSLLDTYFFGRAEGRAERSGTR